MSADTINKPDHNFVGLYTGNKSVHPFVEQRATYEEPSSEK